MTIGVFIAIIAALVPVTGVIRPWPWLLGAVLLSATVLAVGYVARRYRLAAVAVTLLEAAAWALALTFVFFRDTALLWIIPTPATLRAVGESLTPRGTRSRWARPRWRRGSIWRFSSWAPPRCSPSSSTTSS